MQYKVEINGIAIAFDSEDQIITDPIKLKLLDGYIYQKEFQYDYIGGTPIEDGIREKLKRSGQIHFSYFEKDDHLKISTVFYSNKELTQNELEFLLKDTEVQWEDGMGENFYNESYEEFGFTVQCLSSDEVNLEDYPTVNVQSIIV